MAMYFTPGRSFFAIRGVPMPTPKECKVTYQDFDSDLSTRATDGTMVRDRITTKRKLELSWNPLTPEDTKMLLSAVWTPLEYSAISYDQVSMPGTYDEYQALGLQSQNDLLNRIYSYTGVRVDPVKFYEDSEYRTETLDKIDDGLAETNAERNDKVFFPVTFKDPRLDQYVTMTVYVGDRNASTLYAYKDVNGRSRDMEGDKARFYYKDISFNLIEK